MTKKIKKKCQKILKRQAYAAAHMGQHSEMPQIKMVLTKYLVDHKEVSEKEFMEIIYNERPSEQFLDWLNTGIAGTLTTRSGKSILLQIERPRSYL